MLIITGLIRIMEVTGNLLCFSYLPAVLFEVFLFRPVYKVICFFVDITALAKQIAS